MSEADDIERLREENRRLRERLAELEAREETHRGALVLQERVERELQFAHALQSAFLPARPPQLEGLALAAHYRPAMKVGGDFYDFIPLPDSRLGIVIGDVSGKGIPGALFMARFSSDFRALALSGLPPGQAMSRANEAVCHRSRRGLFVTALYAVLDPGSGRTAFSNAGHPVPLVGGDGDGLHGLGEAIDVPLGVVPGTEYPEASFELPAGGTLLLMTDGAFDARSPAGERYGIDRLMEAVSRRETDPEKLVAGLLADVVEFIGPGAQSDDLTVVAAGRR